MNASTFAGRLGRDAETRTIANDREVTGFSLAVDEYAGPGERRTLWIDCSMWGERGTKLAEFLRKGTPVAVSGQVGVRQYEANGETKAVLTLNVREVTLLGAKPEGEQQRQEPRQSTRPQRPAAEQRKDPPAQQQRQDPYPDDDIPF